MAAKKRNHKKRKKKPVNRAAGVTAALFSVVYVLMILALVWHETRERNEVYSNSYNRKRIEVIEAEICLPIQLVSAPRGAWGWRARCRSS